MKKSIRIKSQPLASPAEFALTIDELATLEATRRKLLAERDLELATVTARYADRLLPLEERMKGKLALAENYAAAHRAELLARGAKSAKTPLGVYGWRTGSPAVALTSRQLTEEHVVNALAALGLGDYVRHKHEIAKDRILADCKNRQTLPVTLGRDGQPLARRRHVALARVGLKIRQSESFYVEPAIPGAAALAETLKPATAVAA